MIRIAALLLLASLAILLLLLSHPSGDTAILFTFVGTPLLALGSIVLIGAALREWRRKPPGAR